jgi:hypothetical protein
MNFRTQSIRQLIKLAATFGFLTPFRPNIFWQVLLKIDFLRKYLEVAARITHPVIPAEAGIQNYSEILSSGSRFACPG